VPQFPAVQTLDVSPLPQLLMYPGGKFAYLLDTTPLAQSEVSSSLRLLHVDSASGKLTQHPQVLGTYGPDTGSAGLFGWNSDGTELYDRAAGSPCRRFTTEFIRWRRTSAGDLDYSVAVQRWARCACAV
jgi:hypothetical protein